MSGIQVSPQWTIPEEDLHWSFARSSGPGGQNVNKVNSKATLRWSPQSSRMPPTAQRRLMQLAKRYVTSEGELVIQSQAHRDQPQNIEDCKQKLAALLRQAMIAPKRRVRTKPTKASQRRRLDNKKRQSEKKRSRQRRDFD